MRVRNICLGALVLTMVGLGSVHGQGPITGYGQGSQQVPYGLGTPNLTPETALGAAPVGELRSPVGLSRWILGPNCPDCCGPMGGGGEILSEVYVRSGLVLPFGNGQVAKSLDAGWAIQGGGRLLFTSGCGQRAWTIDASLSNMFNNGSNTPVPFTFIVPAQVQGQANIPVTASLRSFNRTYVNLTTGGEFYLLGQTGSNDDGNIRWRVGFDAGGRYGTEKMHFNQPFLQHATDLSWGLVAAVHSDIEIPYKAVTFIVGGRAEYDYTWSEIAGGNNDGDVQDFNLLVTAGIRY